MQNCKTKVLYTNKTNVSDYRFTYKVYKGKDIDGEKYPEIETEKIEVEFYNIGKKIDITDKTPDSVRLFLEEIAFKKETVHNYSKAVWENENQLSFGS